MNKNRNSSKKTNPQFLANSTSNSPSRNVKDYSSYFQPLYYVEWFRKSTWEKRLIPILVLALIIILWISIPAQDIYLSDLEGIEVIEYEWQEPKMDQSIDGNSLLIDDKWYHKGVGTHANSEISVPVPYGYTHFISEVGVDDEVTEDLPATVQFFVIGDGTILDQTPVLKSDMKPYRLYVNVENIKLLHLKVTNSGDTSNADHADWGNARFVKK